MRLNKDNDLFMDLMGILLLILFYTFVGWLFWEGIFWLFRHVRIV